MNPKVVLPLAVIGLAGLGSAILFATSAPVAGRPAQRSVLAVRVMPVEMRTLRLEVRSQGTVAPRTESELIPEVSGRVIWTSPSLVSGGYFEEGDLLLRIDPQDYEASAERARAAVARAQGEDEHAEQSLRRQRDLAERSVVSGAALDDAERNARVASATLREARVALEQAERDLARTEIRAPFTGRVREERVDVGQFLNRGSDFAMAYATDFVELRLPIADHQLAYLDLPMWGAAQLSEDELPEVRLHARFAGREHVWRGRVVRTEGEIDPKSRLVHMVARVANEDSGEGVPLPVGLFVQAQIAGRYAEAVAVLPRQAMQGPDQVFVVDAENRLRFRDVEVLRIEREDVLIQSGLLDGELVCISTIQAPVDGMLVNPVAMDGAPARGSPGA